MKKKSLGIWDGNFFFLSNHQGFLYFDVWTSFKNEEGATEYIASGGRYRLALPSKQFCGITYKSKSQHRGVFQSAYVGVDQIILTDENNEFFEFKTKILFDESAKIRSVKGDSL